MGHPVPGVAGVHQQTDPLFAWGRLLFTDETQVSLHEQERRGWAPVGEAARLLRPKGRGLTVMVTATIGVPGLVHWTVQRPQRRAAAPPSRLFAPEVIQSSNMHNSL